NTVDELKEALLFVKQTAVPPLVIGEGSNILFSDGGYHGLVIKNSITGLQYEETNGQVELISGAGEILDDVISDSASKGYWGLENLSSIPGTIGATPIQNVGAYGVEVASLIARVVAISIETAEEKVFDNKACCFSYRDSYFKTVEGRKWIIIQVVFSLSSVPQPVLDYGDLKPLQGSGDIIPLTVREKVVAIRAGKFPDWTQAGTAGSFFKNPIISKVQYQSLLVKYPALPGYKSGEDKIKVSLGWVLDNICNLKGFCKNGVCLYEKQALVLVNQDNVSASVIKEFVKYVVDSVKKETGIVIEQEVRNI
ncbi:MAG: UDP-N-acetylmuramate dehydrogenase, partial [Candidatus Pacebacteria bacterium]|nr:UDP-N-acetylmuramate dehydrogenase [Candidatus Paceibacterota bacterium]